MTTETRRIADDSALVGLAQAAAIQLRAWVATSWLVRTVTTLTNGLATATKASLLAEGVRTNVYWVRHSFLYRWLTKEPEPDVITIDLRETYTVGPFIALLDRLAPTIERTWHGSRASRLSEKLRTTSEQGWITDSRTVQLLAAALEPPELPDEEPPDCPDEDRRE